MLEAKAKDQGHRRKRSPKKKKKGFQNFFQVISNSLAYPEFLIGGSLNHKSHEMASVAARLLVLWCCSTTSLKLDHSLG